MHHRGSYVVLFYTHLQISKCKLDITIKSCLNYLFAIVQLSSSYYNLWILFVQCHQPRRDLINKFVKGLGTLVSKLQSRNFAPLRMHRIVLLGYTQGHPKDLFLKISVLQANFCWLGDVEEIICPVRGDLMFRIVTMYYGSETPPHPHCWRVNFDLWPHQNWPVMSGHTSARKLPVRWVVGYSCNLLARNSSISLPGSEEQINF